MGPPHQVLYLQNMVRTRLTVWTEGGFQIQVRNDFLEGEFGAEKQFWSPLPFMTPSDMDFYL